MSNWPVKKNFRKFLYLAIGFIIILEILFQIVFFADIKIFKKPILFFNPYCDQSYWDNVGTSSIDNELFQYHPTLTLIKKSNASTYNSPENKNLFLQKDDIVFYGSSFIDHKYFISHFQDNINYAVKSYGLDQIFLSYKLTKEKHADNFVVFGFLMEDLDRIIFNKRNHSKIKFIKFEDSYKLENSPVNLKNNKKRRFEIYSFNLIKNLSFLYLNQFDHKRSECEIDLKKDLFKFFINEIIENTGNLNQKLIFVTFNFQEDILEPSWRYEFIKNYLTSKNIIHLDTKDILFKHMKKNNLQPYNYYSSEDLHLNSLGNEIIASELKILIGQHK